MKIIYKREDKDDIGITILTPSPEWLASGRTMDELAQKDVPTGLEYKIVEDSVILSDSSFRDAWEVNNDFIISENLDKAKDITKDRLRLERKPLLEEQDVLFMKAQETDASTTAITAEKKRLRDITKQADTCTTTDQLKALSVKE